MNILSKVITLSTILYLITFATVAQASNLTVRITTADNTTGLSIGDTVTVDVYADFDAPIEALYYELDFDGAGHAEISSRATAGSVTTYMQLLSLIQQSPLFVDSLPYSSRAGILPVTFVDKNCDGTPGVPMVGLPSGTGVLIETLALTILEEGELALTIQNPSAVSTATNPNGDLFTAQTDSLNDTIVLSACSLTDCDMNGVGDDCDLLVTPARDCDGNGILDDCDIASQTHSDCNLNEVPDTCDLSWGISDDEDNNNIPDECDLDCDLDTIPDSQSTSSGTVPDCNLNGIPDSCEVRPGDPTSTSTQDSCSLAESICPLDESTIGAATYSGTTSGAGVDFGASCGGSLDVFYRYVPAADGYLSLDFCGSSSDIVASIHTDCDAQATELACVDDVIAGTCTTGETTSPVIAPTPVFGGTEYYIRVAASGADIQLGGPFTMTVTGPQCVASGGAGDCNNNGVPDDCDVGSTSQDVNANGIPDECEADCNNNSVPDDYDIAIATSNDCNTNAIPDECEFEPSLALPADDCTNAQAVCTGNAYIGSTSSATPDGNDTCTFMSNKNDVWYKYTAATSGSLTVSLCGSQFNTIVSVHEDYTDTYAVSTACDNALSTTVACNDDSQTCEPPGSPTIYGESEVTLSVAQGTTYYIRVAGKAVDADFIMTLNGPACVGDCNGNGIPDDCDVDPTAGGTSPDCNNNSVPDECEQGTITCPEVRVPTDYATIQEAIDNSPALSEIIIEDGVYTGTGNTDIDFNGVPYVLRSENGPSKVTIDCAGADSAFDFDDGETSLAVVEGLEIVNCVDSAIKINLSSPTVRGCILRNNSAVEGGAINAYVSDSLIDRCQILSNTALSSGGGIHVYGLLQSGIVLRNSVIADNTAGSGGGIKLDFQGQPLAHSIVGCTFANNSGGNFGGAIYAREPVNITNSILWGNSNIEFYDPVNNITFSYCNIQGGASGTNMLDADPRFIDQQYGDYRLISISPCIDAGDVTATSPSDLDFEGQARINPTTVDIGADEFYIPALQADNYNLSLSTGGSVNFTLDAGVQYAGLTYVMAGSASGTIPGAPLPSGLITPLNPDAYSTLTLQPPANLFSGMTGTLDASGRSTAPTISFQPGEVTLPAGTILHHAFVVFDSSGAAVFVSQAEPLILDP